MSKMDAAPFQWIDPCGYQGLKVTQLADHGVTHSIARVGRDLLDCLKAELLWRDVDWLI